MRASLLLPLLLAFPTQEKTRKLRVAATLPVLADLARQIGGEEVEVRSLGRGTEDPHSIVPTPSLMNAVNKADLFVELGLSLELWAERVLEGAGNPRIRRGAKGHVFASRGLKPKEVPTNLSRASGDLHPEGNPHVWMDPVNLRRLAANIAEGLKRIAPDRAELFDRRLSRFQRRLDEALYGKELTGLLGGGVLARLAESGMLMSFLERKAFGGEKLIKKLGGWLARAAPLRGRKVIFYHKSWVYFADRFGLEIVDYVEIKPGIPPSAAHRDLLQRKIQEEGVKLIGILTYHDDTVPGSLARKSGAKVVRLPGTVGALPKVEDCFALFDSVLDRMLEVMKTP